MDKIEIPKKRFHSDDDDYFGKSVKVEGLDLSMSMLKKMEIRVAIEVNFQSWKLFFSKR